MLKAGVGDDMARAMGAGNGGSLNPDWVESLMGFPVGWTDMACDSPELVPPPAGMGADQHAWEPPRTSLKVHMRAARLKALGNAVVPAQVYPFLRAIRIVGDVWQSHER